MWSSETDVESIAEGFDCYQTDFTELVEYMNIDDKILSDQTSIASSTWALVKEKAMQNDE